MMMLNKEIPQDLFARFQKLFKRPLNDFWDVFWGFDSVKLKQSFPTLTNRQLSLISEIISLEQQQFTEMQKEAHKFLTRQSNMSPKKKFEQEMAILREKQALDRQRAKR